MIKNAGLLFLLIGFVVALSLILKKLTPGGAVAGSLIALGIYAGAGFTGIALLGAFFALGVGATAFKQAWKETAGIAKKHDRKRTAAQVFANGGVAAIVGASALLLPQKAALLQTMIAASLASATADTVSSELGVVYGRRFYNIRTFRPDTRGLDGVVSWEGTMLGLCGSIIIALVYAVGFGFSKNVIWIVMAGTAGNLVDSLLGATLERSQLLTNNAVNFFNTLVAALICLVALSV